jgi:hypothetical protein
MFPSAKTAEYRFVSGDGPGTVVGPNGHRWELRTDADRSALADDMAKVRDRLGQHAPGPGVMYVFNHRDELQTDGGYGQVGCLVAVVSSVVGQVLGIVVALLAIGSVNVGAALIGVVAGVIAAMYTADIVGTVLTGVRGMRDRVVTIMYLYMAILPGLVAFLITVAASAASV